MNARLLQRRCASLLVALAALAAGLATAPAPAAAVTLRPCPGEARALCGRIAVPLARDGALGGTVALRIKLVRASGRSSGTVLFLPGGPGQAATPLSGALADPRFSPLAGAVRSHDLLLVDQRGTGGSGLLRCPLLELTNAADPTPEIAACAQRLGPGRDYYQTRDSVDDLEAVRTALRLPRLSVVGVSYGTKVALSYARRYPAAVERLVLDSVVAPGGPDPFLRDTFAAVPRVLGELCVGVCRRRIQPDLLGDVRDLVARLRPGPALGFAVGLDGRRHAARLTRPDLFGILATGDLGPPTIFSQYPAALRSARRGDLGPLLRLQRVATSVNAQTPPQEFSGALLVATTCGELPLPWSPATPLDQRRAVAAAAIAQLGDAPFDPFDAETALQSGFVALCAAWPSPARAPDPDAGPFPTVPTLLLAGTRDLRTPVENARSLAVSLPRGVVVTVAGTGHSTMTTDATGCAPRMVARFFAGQRVANCTRSRVLLPPAPVAPQSLGELPPLPGLPPAVGRTACAVGRTLDDAAVSLVGGVPGLRGSTLTVRATGLRQGTITARVALRPRPRGVLSFDHFSYVRGVMVSAPTLRGVLRVFGPAASDGAVRVKANRMTGRLGGRPVDVSLSRCARGLAPVVFLPATAASHRSSLLRPRL